MSRCEAANADAVRYGDANSSGGPRGRTCHHDWPEAPLEALGNDAWAGTFAVDSCGVWSYRVEAWVDRIASFQEELRRKLDAGQTDLTSELAEGAVLLGRPDLTVEDALAVDSQD